MYKKSISLTLSLLAATLLAEDNVITLDRVSITATKIGKETKEVSQSIGVVTKEDIENLSMFNITDTLQKIPGVSAISKNGGYDTRIFIRGAGVKARYGVREIMVLRDGVPMTDPDSFTRFDFIDMQDVEQVEVTKGPGSIYASGSAGGTIQILSKSVFDEQQNRVRIGAGTEGAKNAHIRVGGQIDDNDFISVTATHRSIDPSWRDHNEFNSNQVSLKHGHFFADDSTLETEISFSKVDLELPTSLTEAEFESYKATGEVGETSAEWQNSARNSEILFINSRYEKEFDGFTFKPQVYYNHWTHFHPVTFMINDSGDNSVFGTDLQVNATQEFSDMKGEFVGGLTARANISDGEEKYTYRDIQWGSKFVPYPSPGHNVDYIEKTLSDAKGDLAETSDSKTYLYGFYLQELVDITSELSADAMVRIEKADFNIDGNEIIASDYSNMTYKDGKGLYAINRDFTLMSARFGGSYKLTESSNVYATVGYAEQIPTESELKSNVLYDGYIALPQLDESKATNYEIGWKYRTQKSLIDIAAYYTVIKDDITQVLDKSRKSYYQNAGEVRKKGIELQAEYSVIPQMRVGVSYAYSDYKFEELLEYAYSGDINDYSGNYVPLAPKHQYSIYASYGQKEGLQVSIESMTWGSYYTDNANSAEYEGFDLVTNMSIGYITGPHAMKLFINNLLDNQYAIAVKGEVDDLQFTPAAPLSFLATYTYTF